MGSKQADSLALTANWLVRNQGAKNRIGSEVTPGFWLSCADEMQEEKQVEGRESLLSNLE